MMSTSLTKTILLIIVSILLAATVLTACGGSANPVATTNYVNLAGQVTKGPVGGATVCAYKLVSGAKSSKIACVQSAADSTYVLDIPADTEIVLEATGGSYTDEVTGANVVLANQLVAMGRTAATTLGTDNIVITPLTTAASKVDPAGMDIGKYKAQLAKIASIMGLSGVDLSKQLSTFSATNKPTSKYDVALGAVSQMMADGKSLDDVVGMLKTSSHSPQAVSTLTAAVNSYATTSTVSFTGITISVVNFKLCAYPGGYAAHCP